MSAAALIVCDKLTKVYNPGANEVRALDGVSLSVEEGEFVAIIGASGSGKSTLLNMIGGLDRPTGGTIQVNGQELSGLNDRQLAQYRNETVGFVFQQFQLLPKKTALQNVILPMHYARQRPSDLKRKALTALGKVGLGDRAGSKPTQMSGGQQQRVAIARALVTEPALLLADEPTGALDSQTSAEVMELLADLNRVGVTVIVITHDPETARYAGRVIRVSDGLIVSDERQAPLLFTQEPA